MAKNVIYNTVIVDSDYDDYDYGDMSFLNSRKAKCTLLMYTCSPYGCDSG